MCIFSQPSFFTVLGSNKNVTKLRCSDRNQRVAPWLLVASSQSKFWHEFIASGHEPAHCWYDEQEAEQQEQQEQQQQQQHEQHEQQQRRRGREEEKKNNNQNTKNKKKNNKSHHHHQQQPQQQQQFHASGKCMIPKNETWKTPGGHKTASQRDGY